MRNSSERIVEGRSSWLKMAGQTFLDSQKYQNGIMVKNMQT
jgi:hypothetical protein